MFKGIVVGILLLATQGIANAKPHTERPVHNAWGGFPNSFSFPVPVPQQVHPTRPHKTHHRIHRSVPFKHHPISIPTLGEGDLVTVPTAAGISITVQKKLAPQFQGFVADLVKLGYTPKHIGCWAPVGTHVANSNHYHGGACDFDQTGWGRTARQMYSVSSLTAKWGLRDGCSFRRPDCGHIDDGTNVRWKSPNNLIARYVDYQTTPVVTRNNKEIRQLRPTVLEPFEE